MKEKLSNYLEQDLLTHSALLSQVQPHEEWSEEEGDSHKVTIPHQTVSPEYPFSIRHSHEEGSTALAFLTTNAAEIEGHFEVKHGDAFWEFPTQPTYQAYHEDIKVVTPPNPPLCLCPI